MGSTKITLKFPTIFFIFCFFGMSLSVVGQAVQPIAFVNVNVISMDSEYVLNNQTVITFDSRIINMGSVVKVQIPENAIRIDGSSKYLMPGLADMHTHSWGEDFILFIANGITTIRNMRGSLFHLDLREEVILGETIGPTIYLSGPYIDGPPSNSADYPIISDPKVAAALVVEQKEAGYDFIKVLSQLSPEVFDAIDSTAQTHNIQLIGHPPFQVDFDKVLSSSMTSIEHLYGYNLALMADDAPKLDYYDRSSWLKSWMYFDETKLQGMAEKTASEGIWNCPTLVIILNGRIRPSELKERMKDPNLRYVVPNIVKYWTERKYLEEEAIIARKTDRFRKKTVKALHDAGGKLLLGTDTQQFFTIPGFSLHEELEHFVDAGLSPYEAIKAGTSNAAEFLGASNEFGKVAIGMRADLILLHSNPLEDVRNAKDRVGVMLRGKWFSETELKNMLEDLALSNEKTLRKINGIRNNRN